MGFAALNPSYDPGRSVPLTAPATPASAGGPSCLPGDRAAVPASPPGVSA